LKKAFTQLQKTSKWDSNLSDSKSEEEDSHFQFDNGYNFTQMEVKTDVHYGSDLWASLDGIDFQVQSQHVTEKQWWNHGSD
jgi:hypothetical protein